LGSGGQWYGPHLPFPLREAQAVSGRSDFHKWCCLIRMTCIVQALPNLRLPLSASTIYSAN